MIISDKEISEQDIIIDNSLPYADTLNNAAKNGIVLHRNNIYGSGAPVDAINEEMLNFILTHSKKSVLDIGCGLGSYMKKLMKKDYTCTGIETNNFCVTSAKKNGLNVFEMKAQDLRFPDKSFDTTIMIEVLEHLDDLDNVIQEVKRVTKYNMIISVPNIGVIPYLSKYNVVPWHLLEATHINFFTKLSLENYLKKYFCKVYVEEYGPFAQWCNNKSLYYHLRAEAIIE